MSAISDWAAQRVAHRTIYHPPEGPAHGAIHIQPRLRPLQPLQRLRDEMVRLYQPRMRDVRVAPLEPFTTIEGERAALFTFAMAQPDGRPFAATLGFVLGDDCYDRIDAYCADQKSFAVFHTTMRGLLYNYRLQLGMNRMRRFAYAPPRQWQGRGRGLRAEWFPRDYPRHATRLVVFPALPYQGSVKSVGAALHERLRAYGFDVEETAPSQRLITPHGLGGALLAFRGRSRSRAQPVSDIMAAALLDERYLYLLRLDTVRRHADADRALLLEVTRSVEPVPRGDELAGNLARGLT